MLKFLDIDGVLNSQYNFCIDYGTKFCNEIGKYKLENVHAIDTTDMFLWGDEVAHKFWNKYNSLVKWEGDKYADFMTPYGIDSEKSKSRYCVSV